MIDVFHTLSELLGALLSSVAGRGGTVKEARSRLKTSLKEVPRRDRLLMLLAVGFSVIIPVAIILFVGTQ